MLEPSCKRDSGAALLLSLWALFLLAAVVFAWALELNSRLAVSATAGRVLSAEAMACSGAEVALAREVTPSSANLHRRIGNGDAYDVQISGECGRLNLNFLTQGEDQNKVQILKSYLHDVKGIDLNDLDVMIDSLLDWVSPSKGIQHLNACPETDDYRPPHQPLSSLDELKKVCGWADFTSKPGWDADFTVVQGCGAIDVAYASRDVLRALLDAFSGAPGDDRVDAFLQLRQGPDGIDGTADDGVIDPSAALAMLGVPQVQPAGNQVGIQTLILPYKSSNVFRVVSVGKSGDITRSIEMVVQKPIMMQQNGIPAVATAAPIGNGPRIFSWKEL
jgi:hypothetical protein